MSRCIFCLEEKDRLTREHIIPAALGGSNTVPNSVCKGCQSLCNSSFEHRFLKGSNFVALLRAHIGIRGRRNEPVYGFDRHGQPLTTSVQPGFPLIRIGLSHRGFVRPMQIVFTDDQNSPISYSFLPEKLKRPIFPKIFDDIVGNIPNKTKYAALWADGDIIPANPWRELLEAFVAWCNNKEILPLASTISAKKAHVEFWQSWGQDYVNRGIVKMCFMYTMSKIDREFWYSDIFNPIRYYVLKGDKPDSTFWRHSPILTWDGDPPGADIIGERKLTYLLGTFPHDNSLYCIIKLSTMGLFVTKISSSGANDFSQQFLTIFQLKKEGNEEILRTDKYDFDASDAERFARQVCESGKL